MAKPSLRKKLITGLVAGILACVAILLIIHPPITLYGRVVDQNGSPVPDAVVDCYRASLNGFALGGPSGPDYTVRSDSNGNFEVRGRRGVQFSVQAKRDGYGYVSTMDSPIGSGMVVPRGSGKSASSRITLALVRLGELEQLQHTGAGYQKLSANGDGIRLCVGKDESLHVLEFELRADPRVILPDRTVKPFNWELLIRVPHGGIVTRDGIDYTAPEKGYLPQQSLGAKASDPGWRSTLEREAFIRFEDGTHARIKLALFTDSDDEPLYFESWFNQKPGSRQLAPGWKFDWDHKAVPVPKR